MAMQQQSLTWQLRFQLKRQFVVMEWAMALARKPPLVSQLYHLFLDLTRSFCLISMSFILLLYKTKHTRLIVRIKESVEGLRQLITSVQAHVSRDSSQQEGEQISFIGRVIAQGKEGGTNISITLRLVVTPGRLRRMSKILGGCFCLHQCRTQRKRHNGPE